MKLITLNTWGGRIQPQILDFFERHKNIDIFCLQEIYHETKNLSAEYKGANVNLFSTIQDILKDHIGYFRPALPGYGLAVFVTRDIEVFEEGDITIFTNNEYISGGNHSRNLQYVKININDKKVLLVNVHGLWNGKGKTDTDERVKQSEAIKNFIDSVDTAKIVSGDFNLRPDTKSIALLEKDMNNLIKDYNVTSTRTELYTKPEKHADYIFTSPEIRVKDFKVLPDQVSDHAALYLEFEL